MRLLLTIAAFLAAVIDWGLQLLFALDDDVDYGSSDCCVDRRPSTYSDTETDHEGWI